MKKKFLFICLLFLSPTIVNAIDDSDYVYMEQRQSQGAMCVVSAEVKYAGNQKINKIDETVEVTQTSDPDDDDQDTTTIKYTLIGYGNSGKTRCESQIQEYDYNTEFELYTFPGSNLCIEFGEKLDSSDISFYENYYKFLPQYYKTGSVSECSKVTTEEGRYVVKYIREGTGRNIKVFRTRGTIINGQFVLGDKKEIAIVDIINFLEKTKKTFEQWKADIYRGTIDDHLIKLSTVLDPNSKNLPPHKWTAKSVYDPNDYNFIPRVVDGVSRTYSYRKLITFVKGEGDKIYIVEGHFKPGTEAEENTEWIEGQGNVIVKNFIQTSKTQVSQKFIDDYLYEESDNLENKIEAYLGYKNDIQESIRNNYENERVGGLKDGRLFPSNQITRGQVASLLVIALDVDRRNVSGTNFSDVPSDHINYSDVLALKNLKVLQGKSDGLYHPDDLVSREEFVSTVIRLMESKNFKFNLFDNALKVSTHRLFPDIVEGPHKQNVVRLSNMKYTEGDERVINGYSDGSFKGSNPITIHEAGIIAKQAREAYLKYLSVTDPAVYSNYF